MTISAISIYHGGTIDEVTPLARALKAKYQDYGIGYRLSRFQSGPNQGDWLVVVTFADAAAYDQVGPLIPHDAEVQQLFGQIAKFARRISRELVTDLDL